MNLPKMIRIRQHFEAPTLQNIPEEIAVQTAALHLEKKVTVGDSVAVACSSRGITNYSKIVYTTIQSLKNAGLNPFLFPCCLQFNQ